MSETVFFHCVGEPVPVPDYGEGVLSIEVADDGLAPVFNRGDVLFLDPPADPAELIGETCAVTLGDGRTVIARLLRRTGTGRWDLGRIECPEILARDLVIRAAAFVRWYVRGDVPRRPH